MDRAARTRAEHIVIRAVIINHIVLVGDVGHVHRVVDVGDVL